MDENEIKRVIGELRSQGWTYEALGREIGTEGNTVWRWAKGMHTPAHTKPLLEKLQRLLQRRRVPRQRRGRPPKTP